MMHAATHSDEPQPRQSSAEALSFFGAIGREQPFLFRALIEVPEKRKAGEGWKPVQLTGSFELHAQQLRRLNDAGYGIFVQVNPADGHGWTGQHIVAARCLFVDFDGIPLEHVSRMGLIPHIEVETSPGKRHYYWRVDDLAVDQFSALQKRLIALFGSDKSVHDLPRIMRLPGFLHMKNPEAPQLVRVVSATGAEPYAIEPFTAALGAAEKAQGIGSPDLPKKALTASISAPGKAKPGFDVECADSALRHLINLPVPMLDLADRSEWVRVGLALKGSYGEDGFAVWLNLSCETGGFEGEDDCRRTWDSFKGGLPAEKQLTMGTFFGIAREHGWEPALPTDEASEGGRKTTRPDAATIILQLAEGAGDEPFLGFDELAYVTYRATRADGTEQRVSVKLDSSEYRQLLALRYHEDAVTRVAPREQINAAVMLMEARARAARVRHPVYLRYAHHSGRVYVNVDPDKGLVAEIDNSVEEWRFVSDPPVKFVAGSRGPLPMPERGGSLDLFAKHFAASPDDLTRTIGLLLAPYQPSDVYPIGLFEGAAGATKSNSADKMLALTDPPRGSRKAARFSMADEERNLHVHASRCSVVYIDNVSAFSAEVADQLCRLATGAASSFRRHHTMDEEQTFALSRPLIVTAISTPSSRADLLSRSLRVTVLPPVQVRTEEAVWRDFDADSGKMLGFLFSCVSAALRNRAAVAARVEAGELRLPRLADFTQWVEAAGEKLGFQPGDFAKLLRDEQTAMQADAAQRDPVVEGLVRLISKPGFKTLSITAHALRDSLSGQGVVGLPHYNQFKARLARNQAGLLALGIAVTQSYDARAKIYKFDISRVEGVAIVEPEPWIESGETGYPF